MKIRYLREVSSPHALAGAQWSEREIEDHLGRRLIQEGYAEEAQPPQAFHVEVDDGPGSPVSTGIPALGSPFPVAEAATNEPDDPTDVILENDIDATRND